MAGRETLGFLTESSILPSAPTPIHNVPDASLHALKAAVWSHASRDGARPSTASAASRSDVNAGVAARAARDAASTATARYRSALERKSIMYDVLAGRLTGPSLARALEAIDVPSLPATMRMEVHKAVARAGGVPAALHDDGSGEDDAAEVGPVVDFETGGWASDRRMHHYLPSNHTTTAAAPAAGPAQQDDAVVTAVALLHAAVGGTRWDGEGGAGMEGGAAGSMAIPSPIAATEEEVAGWVHGCDAASRAWDGHMEGVVATLTSGAAGGSVLHALRQALPPALAGCDGGGAGV